MAYPGPTPRLASTKFKGAGIVWTATHGEWSQYKIGGAPAGVIRTPGHAGLALHPQDSDGSTDHDCANPPGLRTREEMADIEIRPR